MEKPRDGDTYQNWDIKKKYPKGTQIKVLYNLNEKKLVAGSTLQVIGYVNKAKKNYGDLVVYYRYITYALFGISFTLLILGGYYRNKVVK